MILSPRVNWSSAHYAGKIQGDRPDGYWRLSDMAGTSAQDFSLQHRAGVITGAPLFGQIGPLRFGGTAIYFNGSTWIGVSPSSAFDYAGKPMSLEAWVYIENFPESGYYDFFAQRKYGAGEGGYHFATIQGENSFLYELTSTTPTNYDTQTATTLLNNAWYHLVGTYDGSVQTLYLNGTQVASVSSVLLGFYNEALSIGGNPDIGSGYIVGRLAEVAIYPYALPAKQVKAHYELAALGLVA